MCISFFYINLDNKSKPKFILFFSREEYKGRKTHHLTTIPDYPNILAG